jgi:hypothetical protein
MVNKSVLEYEKLLTKSGLFSLQEKIEKQSDSGILNYL